MTDYGIELAVGDEEGPRVCIPAGKLSAVQVCLRRAPGGADLALTRAAEKIDLALARRDEVGHFVLADEEGDGARLGDRRDERGGVSDRLRAAAAPCRPHPA